MKNRLSLEILISTMNRKDLSFLDTMFPDLNTERYSILIINQTSLDQHLDSTIKGIQVINSREFGLSKSRNLAIENSKGDILLIADDDIEYLSEFDDIILKAYKTYPDASLISFQFLNEKKELAKIYPEKQGYLKSTKRPLSSVEISLKREDIIKNKVRVNENFGLGTNFPSSEEQILKHTILKNGLRVAYINQPILIHRNKTSASSMHKSEQIMAVSAYKYLIYNNWTYLWLMKYVFFLFRHNYISFSGQLKAYKEGVKGISEFKRTKDENKY